MKSAVALVFFLSTIAHAQSDPILILHPNTNWHEFTAEILKTEGLNEFQIASIDDNKVSLSYLRAFDVVILISGSLTTTQADLLKNFVKGGGNLIAFKPDEKLHTIFGWQNAHKTVSDTYLIVNPKSSIAKGITQKKLFLHGAADYYASNSCEVIARFDPSSLPAVVRNNYGKGHAIAFAYDLPKNIVKTRQGNENAAGQEKDGIVGIRAMDLFAGGWVQSSQNILNPADEQMRLLTHCLEALSQSTKPLPRFWYFPDELKSLITLTNDGEDSKESEFEQQFSDVDAAGAKMVLYIKETDRVSRDWVTRWTQKGFEMAGHFDDTQQAQHPDWKTMDSVIKELKNRLNTSYGIKELKTVVNHWFVWCGFDATGKPDYVAQAKLEAGNSIKMDINYAHYDNGSDQGHFLGESGRQQGNFTGSGLTMKFADQDGSVIDLYQHLNNVYDQQYMEHKDSLGFYECFKGLLDRSLDEEVYSYISVKAHNNEYYFSKTPLLRMLRYANEKGIPVWAPDKLVDFLEAKDAARFQNIQWENNLLSFTVASTLTNDNGLTCMIPYWHRGRKIKEIMIGSQNRALMVKKIKGTEYAWVTIRMGGETALRIAYD